MGQFTSASPKTHGPTALRQNDASTQSVSYSRSLRHHRPLGLSASQVDSAARVDVSYAEIVSKGLPQSPEEAAAPPVPELENTTASTASLVDVDAPPSVRTVPSEFGDSVTAETQADDAEHEAAETAPSASSKAGQAAAATRSKTEDTAEKAAAQARAADRWVTDKFSALQENHPTATQAVFISNLAAIAGLSALLGARAWGLVEQGRFNWKVGAMGLSVLGAVGLLESALANYFYKTKPKKQ